MCPSYLFPNGDVLVTYAWPKPLSEQDKSSQLHILRSMLLAILEFYIFVGCVDCSSACKNCSELRRSQAGIRNSQVFEVAFRSMFRG